MKYPIFLLIAVLTAVQAFGDAYSGDSLFALRYDDLSSAAKAANAYLESDGLQNGLIHKAVAAIDFDIMYCRNLQASAKRELYKNLIDTIALLFQADSENVFYHLSMAMIYGRCGQLCDISYSIKMNIPGKIYYHAMKAYEIDKSAYDWTLPLILGKLLLETPKIPFLYTWPDQSKAEALLKENVVMAHHKLRGMLYLAELKRKQGNKRECTSLLEKIADSEPAEDYLFEDLEVADSAKKLLASMNKGI